MEHDDLGGVGRLIDQMGGPQYAERSGAAERLHVLQQKVAAFHVQAHRGLVQQKERGVVQQRAGQFHTAFLAAGECADAFGAAAQQIDAGEFFFDPYSGFGARHAVEGRVVIEILFDREIEIERGLLEHDAQCGQGRERGAFDIVAEHCDLAVACAVEPRDEGEQRGFAGPVQAEQDGEIAGLHGKVHILQHAALAERVGEVFDRQRRLPIRAHRRPPKVTGRRARIG